MKIEIGKNYVFNYPKEFVTLPEYSLRRGQTVIVIRELNDEIEYDNEGELMFEIQSIDGWMGHACEGELS